MSLLSIAWRSVRQRMVSSTLTIISMALGVMLVVAVLVIIGVVRDNFKSAAAGYDQVVGSKGGSLQLVLTTVFHLGQPLEPIPYQYYKEFKPGGKFASRVDFAIPVCLGDNYEGFRVVGTTSELFSKVQYRANTQYTFAEGRNFKDSAYFEAVVGDTVARKTGLKVGDTFEPTHGIGSEDGHKHDPFTVVGVLDRTGTPNDRALFINMEGFYLLDSHARDKPREMPGDAPHTHGDEHTHDAAATTEDADDHEHATAPETATDEHAHDHTEEGSAEDAHAHDEHAHDEATHAGEAADAPATEEHAHEGAEHSHTNAAPAEAAHSHAPQEGAAESHDEHAEEGHAGHGHEGHAHDHKPLAEELREVTAILVKSKSPFETQGLQNEINEGFVAQSASPIREIFTFFETIVGDLEALLLVLALLVVLVASIGSMVAIYNTMQERRREIAIMRALGASRTQVLLIVLFESILLSVAGGLVGLIAGHLLVAVANPLIVERTGVRILPWQVSPLEFLIIPGMIVLAVLAGYVPGFTAYKTDVAKSLSATH